MSEAVGKAGGELLSAQVELDGPEAKQGFIGLTTSVQVGQAALQGILYDIEAGLPYLFIDKLSIQSPEDFGERETGLMRITMTVVGQWRAESEQGVFSSSHCGRDDRGAGVCRSKRQSRPGPGVFGNRIRSKSG